jgi:hypothetical protein
MTPYCLANPAIATRQYFTDGALMHTEPLGQRVLCCTSRTSTSHLIYIASFQLMSRMVFSIGSSWKATIISLFSARCPATVLRRVRAVVVHAFNSQTRRARPHVSIERSKVLSPVIAHLYAAPSIFWIVLIGSVVATVPSCTPTVPFTRVRQTMFKVCLAQSYRSMLLPQTTATSRIAVLESIGECCRSLAAIAMAKVLGQAVSAVDSADTNQSTEALTD